MLYELYSIKALCVTMVVVVLCIPSSIKSLSKMEYLRASGFGIITSAFSWMHKGTRPISGSINKSDAGVHVGQTLSIDDMSSFNCNKLQKQRS